MTLNKKIMGMVIIVMTAGSVLFMFIFLGNQRDEFFKVNMNKAELLTQPLEKELAGKVAAASDEEIRVLLDEALTATAELVCDVTFFRYPNAVDIRNTVDSNASPELGDALDTVYTTGEATGYYAKVDKQREFIYLEPVFAAGAAPNAASAGVLLVSMRIEESYQGFRYNQLLLIIAGVVTLLATFLTLRILLGLMVIKPIQHLEQVVERVGQGHFDTYAEVRSGDELGRLAERVNTMIDGLNERQRMRQSLKVAWHIQQSLLPKSNPTVTGFDVAGCTIPCDETGGDFYDYITLDEDRIALVIADVTGHGIGSALIMSEVRALLRASLRTAQDISSAVSNVNRILVEDLTSGWFVTLFLAVLDVKTRELHYTSAGHGRTLLYHHADGSFDELASTSPPLGIFSDEEFPVGQCCTLEKGDTLLLLTDGVVETWNIGREPFGVERVKELVANAVDGSAEDLMMEILQRIDIYRGKAELKDDVTMVVVKSTG